MVVFLHLTTLCSSHFPFFSVTDDKWKNSIRHNLSLYPEFVKGAKTAESSGHLWHLDMVLVGERKGKVENTVKMEEEEGVEEEEWGSRLPCPQTELQKCAEEILAGVKRPTTMETLQTATSPLYSSACPPCSYSSLLQEEEDSWRNT